MTELQPLPECLLGVTFVAFDTETTGLFAATNAVVEIGAVKFRLGQSEAETFQELVNPGRRIPPDAIRVHGITDEMVASAEPARPVLQRFIEFCGTNTILISHNAPFDISFVGWELNRADLRFGENPILDTIDIYRRLFPGLYSYSLLSLISHFGIARTQDHRALADAVFVRKLFEMAAPSFPPTPDLETALGSFTVHRMSEWSGQEVDLPDRYSDLQLAIDRQLCLEVTYQSPSRGPETRLVWPKRVYAQGSAIYLTAFCEKASAERTFRLDRIADIRLLPQPSSR